MKRYSDFDQLRTCLTKRWPGLYIAALPPKQMIVSIRRDNLFRAIWIRSLWRLACKLSTHSSSLLARCLACSIHLSLIFSSATRTRIWKNRSITCWCLNLKKCWISSSLLPKSKSMTKILILREGVAKLLASSTTSANKPSTLSILTSQTSRTWPRNEMLPITTIVSAWT